MLYALVGAENGVRSIAMIPVGEMFENTLSHGPSAGACRMAGTPLILLRPINDESP